jgi:hypothetical protein
LSTQAQTPFRARLSAAGVARNSSRRKLDFGREGQEFQNGVAPNELTAGEHRDWFAGTPFHKHVPARIERLA